MRKEKDELFNPLSVGALPSADSKQADGEVGGGGLADFPNNTATEGQGAFPPPVKEKHGDHERPEKRE